MPVFPRRKLIPADVKSPSDLLDALNPFIDATGRALDGGVTLGNFRHVMVRMLITAPDDWVPLTLVSPFTRHPSVTFPPPAWKAWQEGSAVRARTRGLLAHPGPTPALGTRIATGIPTPKWQARHAVDGANAHAFVETQVNGTITFGAGSANLLSLEGVEYETTLAPPLWDKPAEAMLAGQDGSDYGVPAFVFCMSAERKDRRLVVPDSRPIWDAPLAEGGRKKERRLRIKRLGGLEPGVEHTVTLLCLYP